MIMVQWFYEHFDTKKHVKYELKEKILLLKVLIGFLNNVNVVFTCAHMYVCCA